MDLIDALLHVWKRDGVHLNPAATTEDLEAFQVFAAAELPAEFIRLYSMADGMRDHKCDSRGVSFWPISRILAESHRNSRQVPFADFLIDSWYFFLDFSGNTPVVLSGNVPPGTAPAQIGSFARFLQLYLEAPAELDVYAV